MRIALLADIHGNTTALDAVLEDIQHLGGVGARLSLSHLELETAHREKPLQGFAGATTGGFDMLLMSSSGGKATVVLASDYVSTFRGEWVEPDLVAVPV